MGKSFPENVKFVQDAEKVSICQNIRIEEHVVNAEIQNLFSKVSFF